MSNVYSSSIWGEQGSSVSMDVVGLDVLVVDDDPAILESVCEALEALGHSARRASDGAQAQSLLRGQAPSLLITDLRMPKLDGLGLIGWCRREGLLIPVVLMSADLHARAAATRLPVSFLRKPFDFDELRTAASLALGHDLDQLAKVPCAPVPGVGPLRPLNASRASGAAFRLRMRCKAPTRGLPK